MPLDDREFDNALNNGWEFDIDSDTAFKFDGSKTIILQLSLGGRDYGIHAFNYPGPINQDPEWDENMTELGGHQVYESDDPKKSMVDNAIDMFNNQDFDAALSATLAL